MKKKAKAKEITRLYAILDGADLSKMESRERIALVKAIRPIRKVAGDFNGNRDDALKRLATEEVKEAQKLISEVLAMNPGAKPGDAFTPEQQEKLAQEEYAGALEVNVRFNRELEECLREEEEREVELEYEPMTEEALERFMEGNPSMSAGDMLRVIDFMEAQGDV